MAQEPPRLKEIRFRFRHEGCWLQETTGRYPGLMLVIDSIYHTDDEVHMNVGVHGSDPAEVEAALADWRRDPHIRKVTVLHRGPRGTRVHAAYSWEGSIYPHLVEHTPVSLGAIRVAGGVEHYQIIGETRDLQDLVRTLRTKGELHVESIKDPGGLDAGATPGSDRPWTRLTERQLEALVVANAAGYYRWPRERSASAVARDMRLSSSAFLDHLRHAEATVLAHVLDDLRREEPGRTQAILARRKAQPSPDSDA